MKICEDYEKILENIIQATYIYMTVNNMASMVIGLSGGIDSALSAALCYEAKKKIQHDIRIIGVTIPIQSEDSEIERASDAGESFCDEFRSEGLMIPYLNLKHLLIKSDIKDDIRCGNIKARLRMIKLFDIANENGGLVISTDNYTEYLLGFWTLHGDVGNFGMIQNLWKTEVYGLADYLYLKYNDEGKLRKSQVLFDAINATPTDGLGITESDFDQIHPKYDKNLTPMEIYTQIDQMLINYDPTEPMNDVTKRYHATSFKRNDPYSIPREYIIGEENDN
jgi:nicotinamide-nucleotide amidase